MWPWNLRYCQIVLLVYLKDIYKPEFPKQADVLIPFSSWFSCFLLEGESETFSNFMKDFEEIYKFFTTVKIYLLFQQVFNSSTSTRTFMTSRSLQPARLVLWDKVHIMNLLPRANTAICATGLNLPLLFFSPMSFCAFFKLEEYLINGYGVWDWTNLLKEKSYTEIFLHFETGCK